MILWPVFSCSSNCSFYLTDRGPWYKHVINFFVTLYLYFEKNIKVFGPYSGNSKIAYPMNYKLKNGFTYSTRKTSIFFILYKIKKNQKVKKNIYSNHFFYY